jgi:toxin ParE1/3/4
LLSENPQLGHPGRVPGTRELVIPKTPFVIPYRVRDDVLEVLRAYHHARRHNPFKIRDVNFTASARAR